MKKTAYITTLFLTLPIMAAAQGWGGGPCVFGSGMHRFSGYGGGMVMWILTIAVLALLVFGAFRLFKNQSISGPAGEDPLKILKARYARGEISREQFESIKKEIS